jgi:hypothetical protein
LASGKGKDHCAAEAPLDWLVEHGMVRIPKRLPAENRN